MPAAVYIPFVNNSARNYAVLHIPISEIKIFQTKERSPYVICLEVYRPDELKIFVDQQDRELNQNHKKSIMSKVTGKIKRSSSSENLSQIDTEAD